jgi:hypothetical protein
MPADAEYAIGLLFTQKEGVSYDHQPQLTLEVRVMKVLEDGKIRNFSDYDGGLFLYNDLAFYTNVYLKDDGTPWPVNGDYAYSQRHRMNLGEAKRAYHTLCQLDVRLARMDRTLGRTDDFAALVARFAVALKAKYFIVEIPGSNRGGWNYDSCDYTFRDPGEAVEHIHQVIATWVAQKLRREVAA